MMQLKLLGILQDFGSPYASLYIDSGQKSLYVAVEQEEEIPSYFRAMLIKVTPRMMKDYLNKRKSLKDLAREDVAKYIWSHRKGSNGSINPIGNSDQSARIDISDDKFDEEFCHNLSSINYYVDQLH